MATANNTIKTRIQLKSDTEANWNKAGPKDGSAGFIPLSGELIVYTPDITHSYSRLKVGDGVTNVVNLPFIDAGTINGEEVEVAKFNAFSNFPSPGSEDKLYIDLSTNTIYHYAPASGYSQLSNFTYTVKKESIRNIVSWLPGAVTTASVQNNTFRVDNGLLPELLYTSKEVVTDVVKEV